MSISPGRDGPDSGRGPGTLYVVATPIGNLADLGERAKAVLREVDVVAAEDTRHTRRLLDRHGIRARLVSLHEHNERRAAPGILDRLRAGASFALVSDAGTPLVSDPGYVLVRAAADAAIPMVPIPGPSAFLCALSVSGLPVERFAFEGFLPAAPGARAARLEALAGDPRTLVFHEAPHRVVATLSAMRAAFGGERRVVIARELTKRHESILRTTLDEVQSEIGTPRGEYVLVVEGRARARGARHGRAHPRRAARSASALPGGGPRRPRHRGSAQADVPARPCPPRGNGRASRLRTGARGRTLGGRESAGQPLRRSLRRGGKSGLRRAGCQVTPGGREPTESATENRPPASCG